MFEDPYQKGYQQGMEDGAQKKSFRPQKLGNLPYLVFAGKRGNSRFLKGYTAGYQRGKRKGLEQEGGPSGKGITRNPHEKEAPKPSPNRLERLQQSRSHLPDTPEREPEY